jgi:hemerythrin-like domain-containing protein
MSQLTDLLINEHEIIKNAGNTIESLYKKWESDESLYKEEVKKLLDFFRTYADKYHHFKEEEVVFPYINNHPDFVLQEMIDEFNVHHEDFREYAHDIEENIEAGDYEKAYVLLHKYFSELQDHIAAENEELFVLIDTLLTENELETLYYKCLDIDRELGEDKKLAFEAFN